MNDYRNLKTAYLDNTNRKKIIENYSATTVITNTKGDGGSLMIDVIPSQGRDNIDKCKYSNDRKDNANFGVTRNWDEYYAWKGVPNSGQQNLERRCAEECKTNQCFTYNSSPPKAFMKESAGYWSIKDTYNCDPGEFVRTATFIQTKSDAKEKSLLYLFPSEPVFVFDSKTKTLQLKAPLTLSSTYPRSPIEYKFKRSSSDFPEELTECCRNQSYTTTGKCVLYTSKGTIGCKENNNTCATQPPTVIPNSSYIMKKVKLSKVPNLDKNAKSIIENSSLKEGQDYFIYNSGEFLTQGQEINFDVRYVQSLNDFSITSNLSAIGAGFMKGNSSLYIASSTSALKSNYGKGDYKFDITFQNPKSVAKTKSIYIIVVDKKTIDFSK
jgi:hypothetical protein